jgi:cytochrome oxidase Cu insertion factor (SCO1/SenC/PrrC family)
MKSVSAWVLKKKNALSGGMFAFALTIMAFAVSATPAAAAPVAFTGVTLPFTVVDMLTTAVNFLTMYGEWILLALGVIFAPVLYGLAMKLVSAVKKRSQA